MKLRKIQLLVLMVFIFGVLIGINNVNAVSEVYADGEKAYNEGSYNGLYIKTFTGGETHIFSIPSLIINDNAAHEIILDEVNSFFSVDGTSSLPGKYYNKSDTSENFDFVPKILYKGPNCGVQSDQEIVNFIVNLRDSYNKQPFKSMPYYDEVFEDYDFLMTNFNDFEQLKVLGAKINRALKCDLDSFQTSDVFPVACGAQDGTFDYIDDGTNINDTCLYTYEGSGDAIVKPLIGSGATKGLHISNLGYDLVGELKYKMFSYKASKINFDYKGLFQDSYGDRSYFEFYIDGLEIFRRNYNSSGFSSYNSYESILLPPGLHEFKWKVFKDNNYTTEVFLDNILLSCVGGGEGCGWTPFSPNNSLEIGNVEPWNMFVFAGDSSLPWRQVTDSTIGTYAIESPVFNSRETYTLEYTTEDFSSPRKFNFDVKSSIDGYSNTSYLKFYIRDITSGGDYMLYEDIRKLSTTNNTYTTITTPLLPAGEYGFKWVIYRYDGSVDIKLDNFNFSCVGGVTIPGNELCGWTDFTASGATVEANSLEEGINNPWDVFTFGGDFNLHWKQTVDSTDGTYAIETPLFPGRETYTLEYITEDFLTTRRFNFDVKSSISGYSSTSYLKFYIKDITNGGDYILNKYYYKNSATNNTYITASTPLLPAGEYGFKWVMYRYDGTVNIKFDNFKFDCVGGAFLVGNEGCGWTDFTPDNGLEEGEVDPFDIFTFGDLFDAEAWQLVDGASNLNGNAGSKILYSNSPVRIEGEKDLVYTTTFGTSQKIEFDIKAYAHGTRCYIYFWIDGKEYIKHRNTSLDNNTWRHFESPLLPAGEHTFKWRLVSPGGGRYPHVSLDNIEFTCAGGGVGCGWTDFVLDGSNSINLIEEGDITPFDMFTFGGVMPLPWQFGTGSGGISKGLYIDDRASVGNREITYFKPIATPQKFVFDIKNSLGGNRSKAYFYINGIEFGKYTSTSLTNGDWFHFESPLLPAGDYIFKWVSYAPGGGHDSRMWLDNIGFSCIGGGVGCGWTDFTASGATTEVNPLELGDTNPFDIFTFTGALNLPWRQVTGTGNVKGDLDSYAIKVDHLNKIGDRDLIYLKTLATPQKIKFDIKMDLAGTNEKIYFYINDVEYIQMRDGWSWDDGFYHPFESPLLPAGDYEFKWRSYHDRTYRKADIWLDNIEFTCIGGGVGCGREEFTLDEGDVAPFDMFTFTGALTLPWEHVTGPGNVEGTSEDYTYGIYIHSANVLGDRDLIYTKTLASPQKIKFYIKVDLYGNNEKIYFYINDVEYMYLINGSAWDDGGFHPFESPLLSAGDYEFKWRSHHDRTYRRAKIWLDNIEFIN